MRYSLIYISILLVALLSLGTAQVDPELPSCTHPVYCDQEILDIFQSKELFPDQKTFVDRPLKTKSAEEFITLLKALPDTKVESLQAFLNKYTLDVGYEVDEVTPSDFHQTPPFINQVAPHYRAIANILHNKWPSLVRSFNQDKVCKDCSSAIPVPFPFVVAGGRFVEGYFWDSFWITQGLLTSGMHSTAVGMMRNFFHLIQEYQFVPNGFRQYYLTRSQPPVTAMMVMEYYKATQDKKFLQESLSFLIREYNYWMIHKVVKLPGKDGKMVRLNRYIANTVSPRPESYQHDKVIGDTISDDTERSYFYQAIASAAESGWDFSSRFLKDRYSLATSRTHSILPVDLNSIMFKNERIIAEIASILGDLRLSKEYFDRSLDRRDAMKQYLWNEKRNMWFDSLTDGTPLYTDEHDPAFFASNVFPIWSGAHHFTTKQAAHEWLAAVVEKYINPAGFPTSTVPTTQQWDGDNGWAPLQWMITEGLEATIPAGKAPHPVLAQLVHNWVSSNYCAWKKYDIFFEKYHTSRHGEPASGGEYKVQEGFGWTNGVMLHYLTKYGFILPPPYCVNQTEEQTN